MSRTKGTLKN